MGSNITAPVKSKSLLLENNLNAQERELIEFSGLNHSEYKQFSVSVGTVEGEKVFKRTTIVTRDFKALAKQMVKSNTI